MNPELPKTPREEMEASLTALLLGELPHEQAAALHQTLAQDAGLAKLYDRLKETIHLVRETVSTAADQADTQPEPLKLSHERRQKLLQQFKTVAPKEFAEPRGRRGITFVELGVAAAIMAILGAMLLPALQKAKSRAQRGSSFALMERSRLEEDRLSPVARSRRGAREQISGQPARTEPSAAPPLAAASPPPATEPDYSVAVDQNATVEKYARRSGEARPPVAVTPVAPAGARSAGTAIVLPQAGESFDQNQTFQAGEAGFGAGKAPSLTHFYDDSGGLGGGTGGGGYGGFSVAGGRAGQPPAVQAQSFANAGWVGTLGQPAQPGSGQPFVGRDAFAAAPPVQEARPASPLPTMAAGKPGEIPVPSSESGLIDPATGLPMAPETLAGGVEPATGLPAAVPPLTPGVSGGERPGMAVPPPAPTTPGALALLPGAEVAKVPEGQPSTTSVNGTGALAYQWRAGDKDGKSDWYLGDAQRARGRIELQELTAPPVTKGETVMPVPREGTFDQPVTFANSSYALAPSGGSGSSRADTAAGYFVVTNGVARGFSSDNVPVIGDVPAMGRLFRSGVPSDASKDRGLRLVGPSSASSVTENQGAGVYRGDIAARDAAGMVSTQGGVYSLDIVGYVNVPVITAGVTLLTNSVDVAATGRDARERQLSQLGVETKAAAPARQPSIVLPASTAEGETLGGAPTTAGAGTRREEEGKKQELFAKATGETGKLRAGLQNSDGMARGAAPQAQNAEKSKNYFEAKRNLEELERSLGVGQEQKVREAQKKVDDLRAQLNIPENAAQDVAEKANQSQKADAAPPKPSTPPPIPQPEVQTSENAFSTFSLNVSDVSFKLAAASLEKGVMPEPASVRSEEFINAFDYRDPEPAPGAPLAFAWERAAYPFAQNRDLLRFSIKTAALGRQPGRPLNLVLLLDNSGSMERADRVQIIREALRVLAAQLQPQDRFSIVTFARTARLWVDGIPGNEAPQAAAEAGKLTPQGGTNLEDAMNLAYQTALRHYLANGVNRVVLLTDGAANLGNVDPEALKHKVESNRKQGIALDCFGIGWEGYNDDLLEVLTRNGDGRYGFINTPEEAATEFAGQLAGALRVAASDVKVQVEFNPARVTAYRQIGYAKHQLTKEQFRDNTVDAAEIGAAESGNALYVVEVNPAGEGPLATMRVRYKVPGTSDYYEHEWGVPYTGAAAALEQGSPAMRLAAVASAFSEWLASSPYAAEVTLDPLLGYLSGVPEVYGADARPKKLEWMIRQAKSLVGK